MFLKTINRSVYGAEKHRRPELNVYARRLRNRVVTPVPIGASGPDHRARFMQYFWHSRYESANIPGDTPKMMKQ
jgi:hypothetical protein